MRLTGRGRRVAGLALLLGLATVSNGHNGLYLVWSGLAAMGAAGWMWLRLGGLRRIHLVAPARLYARASAAATVVADWRARTFAVPFELALGWAEPVSIPLDAAGLVLMPLRRGRHPCERVRVIRRDPFGLLEEVSEVPLEAYREGGRAAQEVIVFPTVESVTAAEMDAARREGERARGAVDPTPELSSLRPYREGDDPRAIHWKASSKHGRLIVKKFDARGPGVVTLRLGGAWRAPSPEAREREVSRTASLASALLEGGAAVRVRMEDLETPAGIGRPHLLHLLEWLAVHP